MNFGATIMCLPWNESFFHKSKSLCSLYRWSLQEHDLFFQFILDICQLFEAVQTASMHLNFWTFDQIFDVFSNIPPFPFPPFPYQKQKESIRTTNILIDYIHTHTVCCLMITIKESSISKKKGKKSYFGNLESSSAKSDEQCKIV